MAGNTQLNQGGSPVNATNPTFVSVVGNTGMNAAIGAPADAAASSDTGTFSLIALVKRGLQSLSALVGQKAELPAVIAGTAITRPADTTAYTAGDLVANDTTAANVVPIEFADAVLAAGRCVRIERVRLRKSGTGVTAASFRVHFYASAPEGVVNGDNGTFSTDVAGYIAAADVVVDRAFADGAQGAGVPVAGGAITAQVPTGTSLYALIEARGAYTPGSEETFEVIVEGYRF